MAYQKDFVLRMIEMVRDLIMGILGLIKKGELQRAEESLDRVYYDFLREDSAWFLSLGSENLTDKLLKDHNYNNGHLEILAELFNVEAELELAKGNKKACQEFSEKSLTLFEFLDNEQKTYSFEKAEKMNTLRKRIDMLKADTQ
jgi:hypothetical protein